MFVRISNQISIESVLICHNHYVYLAIPTVADNTSTIDMLLKIGFDF